MEQIKIIRRIGREAIVSSVSKASQYRLERKIAKIYQREEKRPRRASKTLLTDELYEQHKADNENNLIDGGQNG